MRRLITLSALAALLSLGIPTARSQDTGGDKSKKSAPKKSEKAPQKTPQKEKHKKGEGSTTPPPK